MPIVPSVLATLITNNVSQNMGSISGNFPVAQQNPSYFLQMCLSIATGIAEGSKGLVFTTNDVGFSGIPPIPGAGAGVGINVDSDFFTQDLYSRIRGYIVEQYGNTTHEIYPPSTGNSGEYLLALAKGISDSVKFHFSTAWILTSTHPLVYSGTGTIGKGNFSGLIDTGIQSLILSGSPTLQGPFWPNIAKAISESYVATITQNSTGTVNIIGFCVPSLSQVCGIPGVGVGAGVAG
jgi:hypothetical protein